MNTGCPPSPVIELCSPIFVDVCKNIKNNVLLQKWCQRCCQEPVKEKISEVEEHFLGFDYVCGGKTVFVAVPLDSCYMAFTGVNTTSADYTKTKPLFIHALSYPPNRWID